MTVLQACSRSFSERTLKKGEQYFRAGRVHLTATQDPQIIAEVSGSAGAQYDVRIDTANPLEGLYVACSCPHFDDGFLCKHIWAAILEAERAGLLVELPRDLDISVVGDESLLEEIHDGYGYYDDVDDDYRTVATRSSTRASTPSISKTKRAGKTPSRAQDWHRALTAVPPAASKNFGRTLRDITQRERRILYLLDVSASVAAGAVAIELLQQEKRKDGEWGTIKPLKVRRDGLHEVVSADDRALLGELLGNQLSAGATYGGYYSPYYEGLTVTRITLSPACYGTLPRLCASGRFGWALSFEALDDMRLIACDEGVAWQFRVRITADEKQQAWNIAGELYREAESVAVGEPVLVVAPDVVLFADRLARLDVSTGIRWLSALRRVGSLTVPYGDRPRLLEALWGDAAPPEVIWPKNLQPKTTAATPHAHLQIHKKKKSPSWGYQQSRPYLYADVEFDYGGKRVKPDDSSAGILDENAEAVLLRDSVREAELLRELVELGVQPNTSPSYDHQPGELQFLQKRLDEIVARLLANGWQVEAEGQKIRSPGRFSLHVRSSGVDWFELESEIDFGGVTATLPQLLAAVRAGDNYVKLRDGSRGMLPSEWLQRFAPLADFAEQEDGKLRFKPAQSLLLDALLSEKNAEIAVQLDRQFTQFRRRLQKFTGVKPRKPPRTFRGQLRPYQETCLGWLGFLEEFGCGGCLADDMGLGKTIQVLAWLLIRYHRSPAKGQSKPTLIVVPKSLVFNWIEEAGRFAPKLRILNYTGLDRRVRAARFADYDVVLTTYGTLRRDITRLKDEQFDAVILDEAQAIKNDTSQTAKACRLLEADLRLALTGTPIENHLGELWSLFEFLNPGMLGRSSAFRDYCQQAGDQPHAREVLRRGLAPFILRRTKQQVLTELPEKTEQTIHCVLSPAERKKYNELRDYYRASLQKRIDTDGMNRSKMHVLEALLRLRQTACHPGLLDKKLAEKSSAKLDALLEQLREVIDEGHKALVFSQFTSLLGIVRQQFDREKIVYEYLDGRTRNRQEKVERFQSDAACPLFLISLKAGGYGLNLTAADYVFLLDPWWNPAVEAQAIDRTHRIGQTRHVFAYRLIAADTVEEKILELQQQKRDLADAIIASDTNVLAKLTAEDLQVLLS